MSLEIVGAVVLAVWVLVPSLAFVLLYGCAVRGRDDVGNHLLMWAVVVAAIVVEELVVRITGRGWWHDAFIVAAALALGWLMWWRVVRLWKSTIRRRYPCD